MGEEEAIRKVGTSALVLKTFPLLFILNLNYPGSADCTSPLLCVSFSQMLTFSYHPSRSEKKINGSKTKDANLVPHSLHFKEKSIATLTTKCSMLSLILFYSASL